jgi:hypothetical protein
LYLEAMKEILPKLKSKIIIGQDVSSILPMLQLGEQGASK